LPDIQRFLGQGDNPGGTLLGLKKDWMVDVIRQVGNYGEIYDRNLGPDTPFKLGRGINDLWTKGGLMYAPPFR
jgi:general L-amino acid transport system substrate-binding protein